MAKIKIYDGSSWIELLKSGDISAWAKASSKPSYNFSEIGAGVATIGDGANRLMFRTNANYKSGIYYSTPGNESLVFGNVNAVTSWIFATVDPTAGTSWQNLTPALQIKKQGVAINKLIGNNADPAYNLDVNGTLNATTIYQNGTALATVATSGSYNDLSNKPTIPSVSNATITIKQTGLSDQTFTLNGSATTITLADNNTHNSHKVNSGLKSDGTTNITSASASSGDITLGDSGATAGSYGNSSNQEPTYGATFNVPYITVNAKGIITSISNKTVKIPAADNTNTWRRVQLNGTDKLGASTSSSPLNLKAGTNVTITESSGTFTFAATDTTYESKAAASGGTAVSLVTTGEKYNWNNNFLPKSGGTMTGDITLGANNLRFQGNYSRIFGLSNGGLKFESNSLRYSFYNNEEDESVVLDVSNIDESYVIYFPNKSGTFAYTNDIKHVYRHLVTITVMDLDFKYTFYSTSNTAITKANLATKLAYERPVCGNMYGNFLVIRDASQNLIDFNFFNAEYESFYNTTGYGWSFSDSIEEV